MGELEVERLTAEITNLDNVTEQMYLEMAKDFRLRMKQKNRIIHELQKKLIILFSLIERYMNSGEDGFMEEARMILDKCLIEDIGIQELE